MNEHINKRIKVIVEAMLKEYEEKYGNVQSGNNSNSQRSG